jgi:mannose-6-phosphate isomerase-like protein (cupin superfamily)
MEAVFERYRNGSTIVVNALEQRWAPLQRLAESLGAELNARLQMNIYVTPPGNRGFAPHYDMHDVFIAQVHGTKHWRISKHSYELPLNGQAYDKSQPEPTPDREFDLRAGDLLYLPRGTVHSATSNERVSAHVTIGVHPVLFSQLIENAVPKAFTDDVRFRKGLPIGFATDPRLQDQVRDTLTELVDVLQTHLSSQDLTGDAVKRTTTIGMPILRHHLTDLDQMDNVQLTTAVRPRPGIRFRISTNDHVVSLDFHGKTVTMPLHVTDELQFVVGREAACTGADIPGDLDDDGRLTLVRTLLREGFLTRG